MSLEKEVLKRIIKKVILSEDYRMEVVSIINATFLEFAVDFFKRVVEAKLKGETLSIDWYKKFFLDKKLSKEEIAINSGLNLKTIHNSYKSSTKEIVIDAANDHYDTLISLIESLAKKDTEIDIKLTIKFKEVSVELNLQESLIVINTLAVKRAQLRGSLWSTVGKRVETPLMETLCKIFSVPEKNYKKQFKRNKDKKVDREVDFYLIDNKSNEYLCEVKLMGKGNPESADAVIARNSKVFVADTLSEQNKNQLDELEIYWVELRQKEGYRKFKDILKKIGIPHSEYTGNIQEDLDRILEEVL